MTISNESTPDPRRTPSVNDDPRPRQSIQRVWVVADVPRDLPGGMRRHMESHAEGLRRLGVQVSVFYSEDGLGHAGGRVSRRFPGPRLLAALLKRLRNDRPDLVNVHTLAAPAWLAARALGAFRSKIVVMSYAADERALVGSRAGVRGALRRARVALPARKLFPVADGIWCVNSDDADFYRREYRIRDDRLAVIPHAVADSFFVQADETRMAHQLLFVGTWVERKGVDVLAAALSATFARNSALRAVLAGTMVNEAEVRRAFPESVNPRLQIFPRLEDDALRRLYRSSGLLLVPSRLEGLPYSLLEAMAGGCPALVAANSGMKDVVREGMNGWLLDSFDPPTWAERILTLTSDLDGLARASAAAESMAAGFGVDAVAERALRWYEEL